MARGTYIKESYDELMNKVSWPSWSELQSSSIVVAIASAIIALIIYVMDSAFSNVMNLFYNTFLLYNKLWKKKKLFG